MIALLGLLSTAKGKALEWAAAVGAIVVGVLGFALLERRSGAAEVRADDVAREGADRRRADDIAAETLHETGDEARAELARRAVRVLVLAIALGGASACSGGGTSRECSFARPLLFSRHSIAGLDDADALAVLTYNRQVAAICG
ncbi:MAG: hypothetical protein NVS1B6_06370 [Steroidobacteraceae bacterium]